MVLYLSQGPHAAQLCVPMLFKDHVLYASFLKYIFIAFIRDRGRQMGSHIYNITVKRMNSASWQHGFNKILTRPFTDLGQVI